MKKIILLAVAAAGMAAFALPASAMAEGVPLHMLPKPEGTKTIDGVGSATLTGFGTTITCTKSSGTATFTTTTGGRAQRVFSECVNGSGKKCTSSGQVSGVIKSNFLNFDLLTVEDTVTKATVPES